MKKNFIILIVIAVALTGFLYSRPKVVVKDEAKANRDKVSETKTAAKDTEHQESTQAPKLSAEQEKQLSDLKQKLASASNKNALYEQIAQVFLAANRFDSAATYAEKIALADPSTANWMQAGDTYYQAFTLAFRQENVSNYAEKTRECYQKVLDKNPHQLQAKTNIAMTYVQSDSPMQAIMMLREVITEEPSFEPALMNLGVLSMQSGQYAKAADRFKQVVRLNPANLNALLGLGYSLVEMGEKAQAKTIFEDLKKKVKEPTLLEEVNKALESLK
ncbi:Cell division coordinator CpoB [Emticicia aquatica]|uniref:Cell division coordinator CpoB n=1 Tax=Emticicia aquatica TaxID=1681835 RepID=A0ABM9AVL8_9BACT|nr:tetratricopeptide repeat protein [Emticicia aquatica]CAH0997429.1 Cell division coordinator CpoB [Emticicia aquatica]